jgi:hypothetical protein
VKREVRKKIFPFSSAEEIFAIASAGGELSLRERGARPASDGTGELRILSSEL